MARIYYPTEYMIHANRLTGAVEVLPLLPSGHGGGPAGTVREEGGRWIAVRGGGERETEHATQDEAARSLLENVIMRLGAGDESEAEGSRVALPEPASPRLSSRGPGGGDAPRGTDPTGR